jgi:hypothetical protein
MIDSRLVKTSSSYLGSKLLLSRASALSGRGHFLQMDAHREELCLLYPGWLDREEGRHVGVTSWRAHARR